MKRVSVVRGILEERPVSRIMVLFWILQDDERDGNKTNMELMRILRSYRSQSKSFTVIGDFKINKVASEEEMPAFSVSLVGEMDLEEREIVRGLIDPLRDLLRRRRAGTIVDFEIER